MTKEQLKTATAEAKTEIKNALQTVYDALNQGQQKKIVKNDDVRKQFDLYGVNYE